MLSFQTKPVPHAEARALIASKPAVARDIFDTLPQEMQARAFTITGIEDFDVLQAVRDEIAKLPAGADWRSVKKEVMAKISPWFTPEGAANRADLLLSHHAFAAYSATQARIMDAQIAIFPFRQYISTKDGRVRASHAALHGIILPADHEFWRYHTPPWAWRCRCQVVELTAEDRDEERARDEQRAPENRRVLEGSSLTQLETGSLNRGINTNVDVRTPKERGGSYQWSARDVSLPYEDIRQRWTPDVLQAFETKAASIQLTGGGSLLDHLSGSQTAPRSVGTAAMARAATFAEALARTGLAAKSAWSRADCANLRTQLRVENPVQASELLAGISGARATGVLTAREITRTVQDLLDILPAEIAKSLPKLQITIAKHLLDDLGRKKKGVSGDYQPLAKGIPRARVSMESLTGLKGEARRREMRRILSHELMHWLHMDATHPAAARYRAAIQSHYHARTAFDVEEPDGQGGCYRRDKFHKRYCGRQYSGESTAHGLEIPPTCFELWETPEKLQLHSHTDQPDSAAFRDTFSLVHSIFDAP